MSEEKENQNDKNTGKTAPETKDAEGNDNPKVVELKDRLLRLAAEFDNYKKRTAKDIDNAKAVGKAELARKLLQTLDEFELALRAMGKEGEHSKGIEMVYSNFLEALRSGGLEEIKAVGKADPYQHEVILTMESKEKEGTIIEVVRKGYSLNGIMLRPASVIVSNGKPEAKK